MVQIIAGLFSVLAIAGGVGYGAFAYSNVRLTPNPNDMSRANANQTATMIRHVIKKEDSSQITKFLAAAYYNVPTTAAAEGISITDIDTASGDNRCSVYTQGMSSSQRARFVTVTLSVADPVTAGAANNSVKYLVPASRLCAAGSHTNNRSSPNNAYFFGSYQLPANFSPSGANKDPDTHLYRVNITIEYDSNVPESDPSNSDPHQQVTFRLTMNNTTCGTTAVSSCTRYLSTLPIGGGGAQNYSTVGPFTDKGQYFNTQRFSFGLPCSVSTNQRQTIGVYDIDNYSVDWGGDSYANGPAYVQLQYRTSSTGSWVTYRANNSDIVGFDGAYDGNGNIISSPTSNQTQRFYPQTGSRNTIKITLNMRPSYQYQLVVTPVHARNLIGVGLPTETIFGDMDCDYTLTPNISVSVGTLVPGGSIPSGAIVGSVSNTPVESFNNSTGAVVRYVIPASSTASVPGAGTTTAAGVCNVAATITSGAIRNCISLQSVNRTFPIGSTQIYSGGDALTGVPLSPGDRVCYFTAVNRYNVTAQANQWRHSGVRCVMVAAQPKVHILGNDLRVGSPFAGVTLGTAKVAGIVSAQDASWVEYAITAPSSVSLLASQSGAVGGNVNPQSSWSGLTFANTSPPSCTPGFGCFSSDLGVIPNVRGALTGLRVNGTPINHDFASSSVSTAQIASVAGDLNSLSSSTSITTTGDVTINQNITYASGTLTDESSIPQLIIVARNIYITSNVTNIDAWLIATDTINTCSDVAPSSAAVGNLRSNNCDKQLTTNGPVMASRLLLYRTHTDNTDTEAAESINLRGDAYIWASRAARQNGSWQTVYSTELPPRY